MFDPFAEKAFDAHVAALLRARPKLLLSSPAPLMSLRRALLSVDEKKQDCAPVAVSGFRTLREIMRKK